MGIVFASGVARTVRVRIVVLALAVAAPVPAAGQDPVKLQPVADSHYRGVRIATADGSANKQGQRFVVENLLVSQPIVIYVSELGFGQRVRIDLAKFGEFLEPLRTCETRPQEPCVIPTRTDGDVFVRVRAVGDKPADYALAVWVGEGWDEPLPSLFRPNLATTRATASPAPTTRPAAGQTDVAAGERMTARFFAYDAVRRVLVVQDAVGTRFEFTVPDTATLTVSDRTVSAGEYLRTHFNNLPYASDQQLQITWKASSDKKGRVIVSLR